MEHRHRISHVVKKNNENQTTIRAASIKEITKRIRKILRKHIRIIFNRYSAISIVYLNNTLLGYMAQLVLTAVIRGRHEQKGDMTDRRPVKK